MPGERRSKPRHSDRPLVCGLRRFLRRRTLRRTAGGDGDALAFAPTTRPGGGLIQSVDTDAGEFLNLLQEFNELFHYGVSPSSIVLTRSVRSSMATPWAASSGRSLVSIGFL